MVFKPTTKNEKKEFKKAAKDWADGKHEAVTEKYGDISTWDTSEITDMSKLFKGKHKFNGDISNWDVSKVTNMLEMFKGAEKFNKPISKWNVSNVTNMKGMFENAHAFNQFIGNWDVSKVKNMGYMFSDAYAFNNGQTNNEGTAPLDWNVSKVTDMFYMFNYAGSFNQSIEEWDVSEVRDTIDMRTMFTESGYKHPKPDIELSKKRREKQTLTNIAIEQKYAKPKTREEYAKRQVFGQVERVDGNVTGVTGPTGVIGDFLVGEKKIGGKRKTRKSKKSKKKQTRKRT